MGRRRRREEEGGKPRRGRRRRVPPPASMATTFLPSLLSQPNQIMRACPSLQKLSPLISPPTRSASTQSSDPDRNGQQMGTTTWHSFLFPPKPLEISFSKMDTVRGMVGMNTGKILTFAGQLDGFWRSVWGRG
jgi:hypothetical protein